MWGNLPDLRIYVRNENSLVAPVIDYLVGALSFRATNAAIGGRCRAGCLHWHCARSREAKRSMARHDLVRSPTSGRDGQWRARAAQGRTLRKIRQTEFRARFS